MVHEITRHGDSIQSSPRRKRKSIVHLFYYCCVLSEVGIHGPQTGAEILKVWLSRMLKPLGHPGNLSKVFLASPHGTYESIILLNEECFR